MKKIFVFLMMILLSSSVFGQKNSITDVKITIAVPTYNEEGELVEEIYEKSVPQDLETAKSDIATILSVYNTTVSSYNKHIADLEKEIVDISKEFDKIQKKYEESQSLIQSMTSNVENLKETNNATKFLLPYFGLSLGYGFANERTVHLVDVTGDIYFGNFRLSIGPLLEFENRSSEEKKNNNSTGFGILFNIGYIFK
ncbi:MAG: hypothetical protein IJ772_05095 [Bacilli bacterium]|nr:hypothetical protein [Bacilli bacterium]